MSKAGSSVRSKAGKKLHGINMNAKAVRLYYFIDNYWKENNCGPCYREMQEVLDVESISNAQYYIEKLEANGYVIVGKRKDSQRRVSGSIRISDKRPEWYDQPMAQEI